MICHAPKWLLLNALCVVGDRISCPLTKRDVVGRGVLALGLVGNDDL